MSSGADSVPVFKLNNSSDSFSAKSADIFSSLSALEQKHEAYQKAHSSDNDDDKLVKPDPEEDDNNCTAKTDRKHRRRDDNKFKRPNFAHPYQPRQNRGRDRSRRTPDHKANPQKWTKYSLEDVEGNDMTESSNTRAAFQFLEERRKMREMTENPDDFIAANVEATACSRGAITFTRKKKEKCETSESKAKDAVVARLEDCDEEGSANLVDKQNLVEEEVKVTFKNKKNRQRNIRSRQDDDDDEGQNG